MWDTYFIWRYSLIGEFKKLFCRCENVCTLEALCGSNSDTGHKSSPAKLTFKQTISLCYCSQHHIQIGHFEWIYVKVFLYSLILIEIKGRQKTLLQSYRKKYNALRPSADLVAGEEIGDVKQPTKNV